MEIEFDKEIDAILRKARDGEAATLPDSHFGADEIAAFAENALSENLRLIYTAHFADCTRCRKILSNVISLNSEAELETAPSAVPAKIAEVKTPWYRKLFVFPQIAYTMGAVVVLFSGFFGYLILQNLSGSKNSEVSYSVDKSEQMQKSATVANANTSAVSTANTNSNAAISLTNSTTTATNSAPLSQSNTSISAPNERKADAPALSKSAPIQPAIAPQATPSSSDDTIETDKNLAKTPTEKEETKPTAGAVPDDRKTNAKQMQNLPIDGRRTSDLELKDQSNAGSTMTQPAPKTERSAPMALKKKSSEAGATRSVGGKTFNNVGGIWFDSAVGKQKQKTFDRGTSDYLRLDAGLRSIADTLGGTVVIVWNGKAYRIQ